MAALRRCWTSLLLVAGCGRVGFDVLGGVGGGSGDGGAIDAIEIDARATITPPVMITDAGAKPSIPGSSCINLAWSGVHWGIVWPDARNGQNEIYMAIVDANGAKIGGDIRVTNDAADSGCPQIVWDTAGFVVLYEDNRAANYDLYAQAFDASGNQTMAESAIINTNVDETQPALTYNGAGYSLAWRETRGTNSSVQFSRLNSSVISGPTTALSTQAAATGQPNLVEIPGSGTAAVWNDDATSPHVAYAIVSGPNVGGMANVSPVVFQPNGALAAPPGIAWTGSSLASAFVVNVNGTNTLELFSLDPITGSTIGGPAVINEPAAVSLLRAGGPGYALLIASQRFVPLDSAGTPTDVHTSFATLRANMQWDGSRFVIVGTLNGGLAFITITP